MTKKKTKKPVEKEFSPPVTMSEALQATKEPLPVTQSTPAVPEAAPAPEAKEVPPENSEEPKPVVEETHMEFNDFIRQLYEELHPCSLLFEDTVTGELTLEYNTRIVNIDIEDDRSDLSKTRSIVTLDKGLNSEFKRPVNSFEEIPALIRNHYTM